MGLRSQRPGQMRAPRVEPAARRGLHRALPRDQVQRQIPRFGHAHLVGAGQPLRLRPHRQARARRNVGRDPKLRQHRIGAFIDMVHQAGDQQRFGDGIAQRADAHPLGQRPVDRHAQARVTGIFPIAVPPLLRRHGEGDGRATAGRGPVAFAVQLRRDMRGAATERALRQRGGEPRQQGKRHEYDLKNPHRASGRLGARGLGRSPSAVKAREGIA